MENQPQQQQQQSSGLCRSGCGFYGSAVTEGLCSKCFKDNIKRTQDTGRTAVQPASTPTIAQPSANSKSISASMISPSTSAAVAAAVAAAAAGAPPLVPVHIPDSLAPAAAACLASVDSSASLSTSSSTSNISDAMDGSGGGPPAKKPSRCRMCKKRVGLTGFTCRCGGLYCGEHRYDTAHDCAFDYKTVEREEIRKNNPLVVTEKIQRI